MTLWVEGQAILILAQTRLLERVSRDVKATGIAVVWRWNELDAKLPQTCRRVGGVLDARVSKHAGVWCATLPQGLDTNQTSAGCPESWPVPVCLPRLLCCVLTQN